MPLIYQSKQGEDECVLQPVQLSKFGLTTPESEGETQNWLSMVVNVCCPLLDRTNFKRELFIKQLILDFNQALCDTRIELGVYAQIAHPKPQLSLTDRDFTQLRRLLQHSAMAHSATSRLEKYEVAF